MMIGGDGQDSLEFASESPAHVCGIRVCCGTAFVMIGRDCEDWLEFTLGSGYVQ